MKPRPEKATARVGMRREEEKEEKVNIISVASHHTKKECSVVVRRESATGQVVKLFN